MSKFYSIGSRNRGSNRNGNFFDDQTVQAVWEKGQIVYGLDPKFYRKDSCGALIYRVQYGNTNSQNGWEVDHIKPVVLGGGDDLSNLQPLQWQNNRHKGDDWPRWSCLIG